MSDELLTGATAATIDDRASSAEDPGRQDLSGIPPWLYFLGDVKIDPDQVYVTETSALTYSAVWGCVWLIAQTIASLGWDCFQRLGKGKGKDRLDPVTDETAWILDTQSNEEMSAYDFRQVLMKDALTWGNGYAEIERDGAGRPLWLYRIAPDRVTPTRNDAGRLVYEVDNGSGRVETILPATNVFHLKGPSPDGLVGYSVVAVARRSIELSMSTEQYGRTWARRGPMPGGWLEIPGAMKKEDRDAMRESFQKTYGGSANAGRVVVLTGGTKFNPLSLPNSDMQFLESRAFQIEEVCRWYGVPQILLNKLDRSTFNNIEALNIYFVQYCLMAWCRRLETEADIKLFGRINRGKKYTKLNLSALLRGDSRTQVENLTKQVTNGLMLINEGRELLDMNPVPEGDTLLIQGAMVPVASVLSVATDTNTAAPTSGDQQANHDSSQSAAAGGDVQATALNGAQVTSLESMLLDQAGGQLPADSVRAALQASYPLMDRALIDQMVDAIVNFEPKEKPAPNQPSPAPNDPNQGQQPPDPAQQANNFRQLLVDTFWRSFRVESDKANRAANKGALAKHVAEFYGEGNVNHLKAEVRKVVACIAPQRADAIAQQAAERENARSREVLLTGKTHPSMADWSARAERAADDVLGQIGNATKKTA